MCTCTQVRITGLEKNGKKEKRFKKGWKIAVFRRHSLLSFPFFFNINRWGEEEGWATGGGLHGGRKMQIRLLLRRIIFNCFVSFHFSFLKVVSANPPPMIPGEAWIYSAIRTGIFSLFTGTASPCTRHNQMLTLNPRHRNLIIKWLSAINPGGYTASFYDFYRSVTRVSQTEESSEKKLAYIGDSKKKKKEKERRGGRKRAAEEETPPCIWSCILNKHEWSSRTKLVYGVFNSFHLPYKITIINNFRIGAAILKRSRKNKLKITADVILGDL